MYSKPTISKRRADRALERQLAYQTEKAEKTRGEEDQLVRGTALKSLMFRQRIEHIRAWHDDDRILEVGSGAHGLVFGFDKGFCIGVDPLAADYRRLFPKLQTRSHTVGAIGEELPFHDAAFDVVISDNVIDHAADPFAIINELVRVLKPGGLLYFTVNIHHPFYDKASRIYGSLRNIGLPFEISPFADHTVHLTEEAITSVFTNLPLVVVQSSSSAAGTRAAQRASRKLDPDSLLKSMFFKNAIFEVIAFKRQ
jgi:ubiquinone/menaquinone biosynthesis C-methylase UbiE